MVDPLSVAIGAGALVIVAMSYYAAYLRGQMVADHVDMSKVQSYLTKQSAIEALQQDVEAGDEDD